MLINSLNDVEKFFNSIWIKFNSIITELICENNYDKNDLEDIYDFIKRYLDHDKKDMMDEIKKGKKYHIPEDDFMLELVKQFEENIQGQGLFRSFILYNGNQVLKEIIFRIKQNEYSNN
jgi:hypothetical protein